MSDTDIITSVRNFALKKTEKNDIHGFAHVERVYNTCLKIGKEESANLLILKIAALLHDIGRILEKSDIEKRNHAEISAEMALEFLTSNQFNISKEDLDNIILCIRAHSFSNNVKPETLEAKILSDADKLDALGAIGLYRTIGFTVQNKNGVDTVIEHLENKIMKLKDLLYLDISKEIAKQRQSIILEFYTKIKEEK